MVSFICQLGQGIVPSYSNMNLGDVVKEFLDVKASIIYNQLI